MSKALLLIPGLLFALPSCDSAFADKQAGQTSTAIVQILPSTPALADPALRTDNFIANEIASLSMGEVIETAAEIGQWKARDVDLNRIKNTLEVVRIEGTDMARITATSSDKIIGKHIIDDIVTAYFQIRRNLEKDLSKKALDALDNELIAQSDLVQDYRKELTILIQQYGIPYFDHTPNPLGQTELELYSKFRSKHADLEIEAKLLKAQLKTLDPDDPQRKELLARSKVLESQLLSMTEYANARQDDAITLSLKQSNYSQAKNQYEQATNLLHQMTLKQQETRVALKMPVTPLIIRQKPH